MRTAIYITIISTLFFSIPAISDEPASIHKMQSPPEEDNRFIAQEWYNGPYFLAGLGLSGSTSITNETKNRSVGGCHILAAIGYWAYNAFGLELGAFINYSYFHDMTVYNYVEISPGIFEAQRHEKIDAHMWDSSFYIAVMFRWPFMEPTDLFNVYLKIYNGYGTSVYWLRDTPDLFHIRRSDRFYAEGPIFGMTIGNIFNAFNDSTVWFLQITILAKMYQEIIALKDGGVLPIEVATYDNTNNNHLLQIHITVGMRLY